MQCSYPAVIEFKVEAAGKTVDVYSNNYYESLSPLPTLPPWVNYILVPILKGSPPWSSTRKSRTRPSTARFVSWSCANDQDANGFVDLRLSLAPFQEIVQPTNAIPSVSIRLQKNAVASISLRITVII